MSAVLADDDRWSAWDRFVESVPESGFMQSSAWARFRCRVGYEHFAVTLKNGDAIVGGALIGKWTYEPGRCFYYIQEGPVLTGETATASEVFDAVLDSAARHARAEDEIVSHLRIEPRWQCLPGYVRGFQPPVHADDYWEPRQTLCIDLRMSDDDILAQMKPKGRYNVRVARKHGVVVVEDSSPQGLTDFLRINRSTAKRQAIPVKPAHYFRSMVSELGRQAMVSIFFAEFRGRRLATALVVTFGRRATYFFGGSLVLHRRVMAPYLLHYEIICRSKAAGCDWYDMWGVAPADQPDHSLQRVSEFKRKLGGVHVQLVPTLDRVFDAAAYDRYWQVEGRNTVGPPLPAAASSSRGDDA
jgi:lipid II:glycine glycyltransferase (peptidoglycan interpeptide bridge formation enzyme)